MIGVDAMLKIYSHFKGQQVNFPIRLYNPQLVKEAVIKDFNGTNIKELVQRYNYSERTIRRMLRKVINDDIQNRKC
jgi:Mor family transcriptional regulator